MPNEAPEQSVWQSDPAVACTRRAEKPHADLSSQHDRPTPAIYGNLLGAFWFDPSASWVGVPEGCVRRTNALQLSGSCCICRHARP